MHECARRVLIDKYKWSVRECVQGCMGVQVTHSCTHSLTDLHRLNQRETLVLRAHVNKLGLLFVCLLKREQLHHLSFVLGSDMIYGSDCGVGVELW